MSSVFFQWPPSLAGMSVTETVYCKTSADPRKALVYRPAGKGPFPALVCVHGGAWVSGDRFVTSGFAELVAATGIVVMAIDTRLAPRHPYPAAVEDVNCAVRWLKAHAGQYDIDAGNVGALGVSSGGYLVLLASLCPGKSPFGGETPEEMQPGKAADAAMAFVVTCSGVLDPVARYRMAQENGMTDIMACHHAFFGTVSAMEAASVSSVLKSGICTGLPKALFFQGSDDIRLPKDTALRMARLWHEYGGQAQAVIGEGEGHSVGTWRMPALADMLEKIQALAYGTK